ncbi:UNVERIFIED_CONTAM: hypothetical protein NCL1_47412 [Trichonephila clavipes]
MLKDKVGIRVGCLMLMIVGKIGGIRKFCVDRVTAEMIIWGNYENGRQGSQWFDSRNRFQRDDRIFNDGGYQFRNGGQNEDFSRGDRRNIGSSENFSRDKPGLTHVWYHEIDTGDKPPVVFRPYCYDRVK